VSPKKTAISMRHFCCYCPPTVLRHICRLYPPTDLLVQLESGTMCPPKKMAISTIEMPYEPSRDPKVHVLATQLPLQKIMPHVCRSSLKRSFLLSPCPIGIWDDVPPQEDGNLYNRDAI